jgi:hypothetical protein
MNLLVLQLQLQLHLQCFDFDFRQLVIPKHSSKKLYTRKARSVRIMIGYSTPLKSSIAIWYLLLLRKISRKCWPVKDSRGDEIESKVKIRK